MKSAGVGGSGAAGGLFGSILGFFGLGGSGGSVADVAANSGFEGTPMAMSGWTHSGGLIGRDNIPMKAVPASLFDNAPRFHNGLMPGEFPTILKKGEGVFTPGQMQAMSNNAPSLVVNVENKTGSQVKATQSEPRFDGKQWP